MGRRVADVVLIHPPSVYDFRERTIFYGPISDVIPSSPVFEMYPVGFLTLAAFLRRHGYRVEIVNLALLMMRSRRLNVEKLLGRLRAKLFGIDLHWLPHAHGAIEVAALLKRLHPHTPIVFGGLSSTYFHEELIREPSVDFVLRGSVAEPSLLGLVRALEGNGHLGDIPNLTWKSIADRRSPIAERAANGERQTANDIHVNRMSCPTSPLDEYTIDLGMMVGSVVRRIDFWTTVPFHTWWKHPITAIFSVRGCARHCVTCGFPRDCLVLRSPAAIAASARNLASITRAPIFLVGDLRDGGDGYAHEVVAALAGTGISNRFVFEFFEPPSAAFIEALDSSLPHWGVELSPESHDPAIRSRFRKASYSNEQFEASLARLMQSRCEELDLFYMIGLPGQTHRSVLDTIDSIEQLFRRFDRRLSAFITPMGPFIDPGSEGFENAEANGYRIRARTLAEHRALLQQRDWESILNYETEWMTRREIVDATYDAAERLNELKAKYGRIGPDVAAAVAARMRNARRIRAKLAAAGDGPLDPETHRELVGEIREFSEGTINDKGELFPPGAFLRNFRLGGILRLIAGETLRTFSRPSPSCDPCHHAAYGQTSRDVLPATTV